MRWLALVLLLLSADASAKKKPPPSWNEDRMPDPDPTVIQERQRTRLRQLERWVGQWSGKAAWKGCTIAGAKKLTIDISPLLATEGSQILDGVSSFKWGMVSNQLVLLSEGIEVTFAPGKKGSRLVVATGAGCVGKATMTRPTSKIASCDTLRALATIQASCPYGDASRADNLARVTAEWRAWSKLKGKKKKARSASCAAEADALREQILPCADGW